MELEHDLQSQPLFIAVPSEKKTIIMQEGYRATLRARIPASGSAKAASVACSRHHSGNLDILCVKSLPAGVTVSARAGGYDINTKHLAPEHLAPESAAVKIEAAPAPAPAPNRDEVVTHQYLVATQKDANNLGSLLFDMYPNMVEHTEELARLNAKQTFPEVQRFAVFRKSKIGDEFPTVARRLNGKWSPVSDVS
jgi:hypothetical protein